MGFFGARKTGGKLVSLSLWLSLLPKLGKRLGLEGGGCRVGGRAGEEEAALMMPYVLKVRGRPR